MKNNTAILVVSFGTSHEDTLDKTIGAIEDKIAKAFPENKVYRAFTSSIILKVWESRDVYILNTSETLEKIIEDGYEKVIIQPTHVVNGDEYEKMLRQIAPFTKRINILIGSPLLTTVEDYREVAEVIAEEITPLQSDEALVLMGHGTEHYVNPSYSQMEYILREKIGCVFVGTVEGYPELCDIIKRVKRHSGIKKITLQPFMIVAGDHAKNDMASDDDDSWKSAFLAEGFEVKCKLKGLGEYDGIQNIFTKHTQEAEAREIVLLRTFSDHKK